MTVSVRQSQVIDYFKGILPIVVIIYHTSYEQSLHLFDGPESFIRILLSQFGAIAVPFFFFFSGFLFFSKLETEWHWRIYLDKCTKRITTLLIPYILWIAIYFTLFFLFSSLKSGIHNDAHVSFLSFFKENEGFNIFWGVKDKVPSSNIFGYEVQNRTPFLVPMWYIRDLMSCTIISPLIWIFLQRCGKIGIFSILTLFLLNIGLPFTGLSITALFFFSFGGWFRVSQKDFLEYFSRFRWPALAVSLIFLVISLFIAPESLFYLPIKRIYILSFLVCLLPFTDNMLQSGKIFVTRTLTDASFFIYAVHAVLILDISNLILWRTLPFTSEPIRLLKVFLRPALATIVCLSIFFFLRRFLPKLLKILTGDRAARVN